jgi:hypothetical protein
MSSTGPSIFVPNGPLIPSDTLASKTKSTSAFVKDKLVLPSYSTVTFALALQILDPAPGMLVFNSFTGKLNFFNGTAWEAVTSVAV